MLQKFDTLSKKRNKNDNNRFLDEKQQKNAVLVNVKIESKILYFELAPTEP